MRALLPAALFAVVLLLASTDAVAQRYEQRTMVGRLEKLERDTMLLQRQLSRGEGGEIDGVPPDAGQVEVRLSEIRDQLRKLQGQIEEAQHGNRQLTDRLDKIEKNMDFRLNKLEEGARAPATTATPAEEKAPAVEPKKEAADKLAVPPKESASTEEAKAEATEAGAGVRTPRDDYNAAFRLLRQGKPQEAGDAFRQFIADYPKDPLIGNAYYWLGETHYVQRDFSQAAAQFRRGFEVNPGGAKASDNLFKLALSLSALKETGKACVVLRQLTTKFGKTSEPTRQKAEREMERLACD